MLLRPSCRNWQRSAASSLHSACHPERVNELTSLKTVKRGNWLFLCNATRRTFKMNSKYFKGRPSRVESCAKTKQVAERIGLLHSFTMFHDSWRFMAPLFLGWQSSQSLIILFLCEGLWQDNQSVKSFWADCHILLPSLNEPKSIKV